MTRNQETMNKELLDWMKETKQEIPEKENDKDSELKATGICEICGNHKAKFVCMKCHRSICPSCYFKLIGICKSCIPDEIVEKWKGDQPDWEKILGVKWVD